MAIFGERPVTWLYLTATVVLSCTILNSRPELQADLPSRTVAGVVIAQLFVLGAYAVVGRSHRLARGAAFVCGASVIAMALGGLLGHDPRIWAAAVLLQSSAAAGAAAVRFTANRYLQPSRGVTGFRFPLIEFFGWTIVVAIGALVVKEGPYADMLTSSETTRWLIPAFLAGIAVALSLMGGTGRFATHQSARLTQGAAVSLLLLAALIAWQLPGNREKSVLLSAVLYTLLFTICLAIDGARRAEPHRGIDNGDEEPAMQGK